MTWLSRKVFMELKANLVNGEPVLLQRGIQMQTSPLSGIQSDKCLLVEVPSSEWEVLSSLRSQYPKQDCIWERRLGFDRSEVSSRKRWAETLKSDQLLGKPWAGVSARWPFGSLQEKPAVSLMDCSLGTKRKGFGSKDGTDKRKKNFSV